MAVVILNLTSCNPLLAKNEEERISRVTQEAIKNSPVLEELDRLCGKEVAHPDDFVFESKSMDTVSRSYLTFHYGSSWDYTKVKNFYKEYFTQNGWLLTYQRMGLGTRQVEFTKQRYGKAFDVGQDQQHHYAIQCEKVIARNKKALCLTLILVLPLPGIKPCS